MKNVWELVGIILVIAALVGCQKAEPTPAVGANTGPSTGRQGGLDDVSKLALGAIRLEGTENAVTPAQAADLLPLWQVIQGGSLKSDAETQAVLKQVEAKMTESQLAAIDAMGLTFEDVQAQMQEQGIEMPARPGGQQGSPGAFGDLSEDERATRMAEMGIQRPEGAEGRQGGAPGGSRQGNLLLEPLIQLLTERAG